MALPRRSIGTIVLVIAALALAGWLAWRGSPRDAAPPAPPTVASAPQSPPQPLEGEPGSARRAMEAETAAPAPRVESPPAERFVARVVADEDGSPVPDARASVGSVDRVGYLEVEASSSRGDLVRVEAPGRSRVLVPISAGHETRASALEVRLARSAALDVLVLDDARRPLADVRVRLRARAFELMPSSQAALGHPSSMEQVDWEARTGPDGRARIDELPSKAAFAVHATPRRGRTQILPEPIALGPGEVRSLEIVLRADGVVAGWLRKPDGRPVPDAEIWLKTRGELRYVELVPYERDQVRMAKTDEQGRFAFDGVTDGAWIVGVAPSEARAPCAVEVLVEDGAADDVLLTAWDDLFVRGTVVDPNGRPCKATVVARRDDAGGPAQAKSDDEGAFALGPLAPGTYELVATAGYQVDNLWANSAPLSIEAGTSGVRLALLPGSALSGRIVDEATGKGVQGEVTLSREGCESMQGAPTRKDGGFQLGGLEPGAYDLVAVTPGGSCAVLPRVRLVAGERLDALEVAVRPGGRLRVHYGGSAESAPIRIEREGVCIVWGIVSRGEPRDWFVPGGSIRVRRMDDHTTRDVSVEVGELTEVRLD